MSAVQLVVADLQWEACRLGRTSRRASQVQFDLYTDKEVVSVNRPRREIW